MDHLPTDPQELLEALRNVEEACRTLRDQWAILDQLRQPDADEAFGDLRQFAGVRLIIIDRLIEVSSLDLPDVPEEDRKWGITPFDHASVLSGFFPVQAD